LTKPLTVEVAISTFNDGLTKLEETLDRVRHGGYSLSNKPYRPIWKSRTRKLQDSLFALRRINTRDDADIISTLAQSAEPFFDPTPRMESMTSAVVRCRQLSAKLQLKIDEQSEILLDRNPYLAFRKLKILIQTCKNDLSIQDPYTNDQIIDRYIQPLPNNVRVKLLTRVMQGNFRAAALVYKQIRPLFEVKLSNAIHDRYLIIDRRAWIVGQSLKDAGSNAPVSIVEIKDASSARRGFDKLWLSSEKVL